MTGNVTLNVILACTRCRVLVDGESYTDYLERIQRVRFPRAVQPYLCPACTTGAGTALAASLHPDRPEART